MISLNELDIETEYRKDDEEFNHVYQKFCILIIDNDNETAEKLKKEILQNQTILEKIKNDLNGRIFACEKQIESNLKSDTISGRNLVSKYKWAKLQFEEIKSILEKK